jgi:hypothetical protein
VADTIRPQIRSVRERPGGEYFEVDGAAVLAVGARVQPIHNITTPASRRWFPVFQLRLRGLTVRAKPEPTELFAKI